MPSNLHAAPFHYPPLENDSTATFYDLHGTGVVLRVVGDALVPLFETLEGYTTMINRDSGVYCYAKLTSTGKLIASNFPITSDPPDDVYAGLRPSPGEVSEDIARVTAALKRENDQNKASVPAGPGGNLTFGPNNGLLEGNRCTEGNVRGLTVLVEFQDENVHPSITRKAVDDLMNAQHYNANGNMCSVKEFFQRVSCDLLQYHNEVVGPYKLSQEKNYYMSHNMVPEVLQCVLDHGDADLETLNYRNRGFIAALNILYAGESVYEGDLWPHNYHVRADQNPPGMPNGLRFYFYQLTGAGSHERNLRIGTICHENGHLLCRWPDLYDYGSRDGNSGKSSGIGFYCLMGSGSHINDRRCPCPPNSHYRHLVGWTQAVRLGARANQVLTLMPGDDGYESHHVYYLPGAVDDNETFVLENRRRHGLNENSPFDGLAVFHCDTKGSNEWEQGTESHHYQVALIQADGRCDLERNRNQGDVTDLFRPGQTVSGDSISMPHTRAWDGSDSGLRVYVESFLEDGSIRIRIGGPQPADLHQVSKTAYPQMKIPDNFPAGVSTPMILVDTDHIHASGQVEQVKISCSIYHTWRGDLCVTLRHRGDGMVVSNPQDNDGRGNINVNDLDVSGAFRGGVVGGAWVLVVADCVKRDVGKLVSWHLDVLYKA